MAPAVSWNLQTFFLFSGYPNLSSLVQAHLDIFYTVTSGGVNEKSEIALRPDCVCKLLSVLFIAVKLNF